MFFHILGEPGLHLLLIHPFNGLYTPISNKCVAKLNV